MPSIAELLAEGRRTLAAAPLRPGAREAGLLLGRVLGWAEARVLAHPEAEVDPAAAERFRDWLTRRAGGEPIAYLFGEREFYGRTFRVDSRVLIPRPETEHLIETALAIELPAVPRLLDLGTGSGCLAITLALELPGARAVAADVSPAALAVARRNATELGARVDLVAADLGAALQLGAFDLVVSNPPYIAPEEAPTISPEIVRHEPARALFASRGGLAVIARLLDELAPLRPGAWMAVEIGHRHSDEVRDLAAGSAFELVELRGDLAGIPRVALLRRR